MNAEQLFSLLKENEGDFDPRFIAYDDNKKMAVCHLVANLTVEFGTPERAALAIELYLDSKKSASA